MIFVLATPFRTFAISCGRSDGQYPSFELKKKAKKGRDWKKKGSRGRKRRRKVVNKKKHGEREREREKKAAKMENDAAAICAACF